MPLQSSGAISLNEIHIEAGGSTGTTATINDADIRALIDKSSGATMSFNEWYGASAVTPRGLFTGGIYAGAGGADLNIDTVDFITIASTGNASDFGNLSNGRGRVNNGSCGSGDRHLVGGGNGVHSSGDVGGATNNYLSDSEVNTIEYFTFASTGNATDFGDLTRSRDDMASCSSSTRGIFAGGALSSNAFNYQNRMDYVTIASAGNSTQFGNLLQTTSQLTGSGSTTRGVFATGSPSDKNTIQYITIASTGNATDFGDTRAGGRKASSSGSSTRMIIANIDGNFDDGDGVAYVQEAEYITIASTGNATDFGNLTVGHNSRAATSNKTRMVIGGGVSAYQNVIEYLTVANTGNGTDFGDLTVARGSLGAGSSQHGGL